jgi:hypothetical protein
VIGFLFSPVGKWVSLACVILAAIAAFRYDVARDAVKDFRLDAAKEDAARVKSSSGADEASRRCANDPECRMLDDGFKRD